MDGSVCLVAFSHPQSVNTKSSHVPWDLHRGCLWGHLTWFESAEENLSSQISFGKCGAVFRLWPGRVHPGTMSWGKLAEKSKTHLRSCDGGTPILPWWLAAKVDWLQVSHWQRKEYFFLLCLSKLCMDHELLEQGHAVELEGHQEGFAACTPGA